MRLRAVGSADKFATGSDGFTDKARAKISMLVRISQTNRVEFAWLDMTLGAIKLRI
jgi:hypothetical protein